MIDTTIVSDLMDYRRNIDKEFQIQYGFVAKTANSIGVEPSSFRITKCWSKYKRSLAVPMLDDITYQIRDQTKDCSHFETFRLPPSVMFAKNYSTEESYEILLTKFKNEMFDEGLHFRYELKILYKMWSQKIAKRRKNW